MNLDLSLQELENSFWDDEVEYPSSLVAKCYELRKIPIRELTIENLRMLIGQKIGLPYTVPLALNFLFDNPFCSGDLYNGDLLQNILGIDAFFWKENPHLYSEISDLMACAEEQMRFFEEALYPKWIKLNEKYHGE